MRLGLLILAGSLLIGAQTPQRAVKPFSPPEDYGLLNQYVAKDEGCVKDFSKSLAMEGLELRKYLVDLTTYGCIQMMKGLYMVKILNVKQVGAGKDAIQVRQVRLLSVDDHGSTADVIERWILSKQLVPWSVAYGLYRNAK